MPHRLLAESTADCSAPPDAVWAVWADPARRPDWHPRLEWATLDGAPAAGARGRWKPDRARPVHVTVDVAEPGRRLCFTGIHGLPVARGHYEYEVEPRPGGGSRLTHRVRLSGPLAGLIARFFAAPLGVSAGSEAVTAVVRLAEQAPAGP